MVVSSLSPGVYRDERFVAPAVALPTGVVGFVGLGGTRDGAPVALQRADDLAHRFTALQAVDGYLAAAVAGFFANGGRRCHVVATGPADNLEKALIAGLARLSPISDLDLIAIPDSACLTDAAARRRVQAQALRHCREHGDRFAILDAPQGIDPLNSDIGAAFAAWRKELAAEALENGACYYPWIKVLADDGAVREVPPCGHIAGVYARTDTATGVFKAPANETLNAVLDLTYPIDAEIQGKLNPIGVNCIRALPGRGLRVYGARTLSLALTWRYVNVRRLVLTLGRWIERNMAWSAFEPSTPRLWSRIARELGGYLDGLWLSGALRGGSPTDAYTVKCDAETNPPAVRDRGEVVVEVALAPALPAERLVLRITQSASGVRLE